MIKTSWKYNLAIAICQLIMAILMFINFCHTCDLIALAITLFDMFVCAVFFRSAMLLRRNNKEYLQLTTKPKESTANNLV